MASEYDIAVMARKSVLGLEDAYRRLRRQLGPVVGPTRSVLDEMLEGIESAKRCMGKCVTALTVVDDG